MLQHPQEEPLSILKCTGTRLCLLMLNTPFYGPNICVSNKNDS